MSNYYYLDVTLEFNPDEGPGIPNLTPELYKNHIMQCMKRIFGEIGGNTTVDVLKFDKDTLRNTLRVPKEYYQKLHCALTLCGSYEDRACAFQVHKASPILAALGCESRTYQH